MRRKSYRSNGAWALSAAIAVVLTAACQQEVPTALDDGQLPAEPLTIEIEMAWSEFGSDLRVLGGYGTPLTLPSALVARTYEGSLNANTLVRFDPFPTFVVVRDESGTTQTDTDIRFIGATVVVRFDTVASIHPGDPQLVVGAIQEEWDAFTATWESAVDTVADQRAWTVPGGGAINYQDTATWLSAVSDSVWLRVDSATVASWGDGDSAAGAHLSALTDDVRLRIVDIDLRLDVRSTVDPDTSLIAPVEWSEKTFIYDPAPAPPTGLRVGGVPGWRSVLDVTLPSELNGPPALCSAVGCPFVLDATHVSRAGIILTSTASDVGFQPTDTLRLDARSVLSPDALPKSPLGLSLLGGGGTPVESAAFGASPGLEVEVPVTSFIRTQLGGTAANDGIPPTRTLALLGLNEPSSLPFASFAPPGSAGEPRLNLILTVGSPVELP